MVRVEGLEICRSPEDQFALERHRAVPNRGFGVQIIKKGLKVDLRMRPPSSTVADMNAFSPLLLVLACGARIPWFTF